MLRCKFSSGYRLQGEIGKSGFLIYLFYIIFFAYLPLQTIPARKFATQHPQPVYSLLKLLIKIQFFNSKYNYLLT
jgi:hypothetical protein